jgi:hypothetical protein
MLHPHQPILRTHALLLECRGYEVAAVDSIVQMILKLEAEEDSFDGLLIEISEVSPAVSNPCPAGNTGSILCFCNPARSMID